MWYKTTSEDESDGSFWISYTDLVTGFLIVFIIIALALKVKLDNSMPIEAKKTSMQRELEANLSTQCGLKVTEDATVRFSVRDASAEQLFSEGKANINSILANKLDCFLQPYLDFIAKEYENQKIDTALVHIKEIRIEGHTDSKGNYLSNLKLSSERAYGVADFMYKSSYFNSLSKEVQNFIKTHTIAVGYSDSKRIDSDGKLISDSKNPEDKDYSRRVEFRIIIDAKK
ncbi:MAG: OmpA family protein [Bernardetiaceae bacterium]|nr:OmpA family protein [Bernardetiaceae bacterium]